MGIAKSIYHKVLRIMPTKMAVYLIYFRGYKSKLNLKDPQHFGEKIQWLKLYGNLETLGKYVDKYRVREYVKETIGAEYLVNLLGVYDNPREIDFDELPNSFVLKSTNGCKSVLLVEDKNHFDDKQAQKLMSKWLKDKYHLEKKEMQYKNVINRIIIEEFMNDDTGDLVDYKFYCYNGEPQFYAIASERKQELKYDYYDVEGNLLKEVQAADIKQGGTICLSDDVREKMIEISRKLSYPFQFVRVDLYYVNKEIKFGELTFTDGAGSDPFHPDEFDYRIARDIKLIRYPDQINEYDRNY